MTLAEYQAWLAAAPYGKRLPTALYLVRDTGTSLGAELDRFVAQLVAAYQVGPEFNVLKFRTDELKVSFLAYPDFFDVAHPVLRKSITADLRSGAIRQTDYGDNLNPPILHRKEAFLPASHPRRAAFAELTRLEEQAGLYERPETIGFRLNWERLLADKGLVIEGHSLRRAPENSTGYSIAPVPIEVHRHKTAITRYDLSKPVKRLLEHGLLRTERTFFDYGCGQGTDVSGLRALGYAADGWDPVHCALPRFLGVAS